MCVLINSYCNNNFYYDINDNTSIIINKKGKIVFNNIIVYYSRF